ncbi:hypothetical protein Taro_050187 [Colocasia esculenta]|uniref:Protein kinase domain-containing protein n=1 Tax=Colocasia esculenta TaxID=4460 RepID=A0A843XCU0_COLES|nr:hypothetical protein [Colocasia esculenta]
MNRGSLDRPLFAAVGSPVLEWGERVEIALGTTRGLAYLHGGCDHKIIHYDVKPENILLGDHSQVKTPEWLTNSAISDRTDVYSYDMVLLEIVHGRKNCVVVGHTDDADLGGEAGSEIKKVAFSSLFFKRHFKIVDIIINIY